MNTTNLAPRAPLKIYDYAVPLRPEAELFPPLEGDDLQALADDIREHGLREPIVLFEKHVLDGRNRQKACELAGVEPRYEEWKGEGNPLDFVISRNLRRRHLNESQRAMVAARLMEQYRVDARLRQSAAGGAEPGPLGANLREARGKAADRAAKSLNVSPRSVEHAGRVRKKGTVELNRAVDAGKIPVSRASRMADLPPDEQRKAASGENPAGRSASSGTSTNHDVGEVSRQLTAAKARLEALKAALAKYRPSPDERTQLRALAEEVHTLAVDVKELLAQA